MRTDLFEPTAYGEARLLLLIDAFSSGSGSLDGRTKLAKLDFLLRYPNYLKRALDVRNPGATWPEEVTTETTIESRMIRYRYGPWDPAYFSLIGRLVGKNLVVPVPTSRGIGYRTTEDGKRLANELGSTDSWKTTRTLTRLLRQNFNLTGTTLKNFVYEHFPEVTRASWGEQL